MSTRVFAHVHVQRNTVRQCICAGMGISSRHRTDARISAQPCLNSGPVDLTRRFAFLQHRAADPPHPILGALLENFLKYWRGALSASDGSILPYVHFAFQSAWRLPQPFGRLARTRESATASSYSSRARERRAPLLASRQCQLLAQGASAQSLCACRHSTRHNNKNTAHWQACVAAVESNHTQADTTTLLDSILPPINHNKLVCYGTGRLRCANKVAHRDRETVTSDSSLVRAL